MAFPFALVFAAAGAVLGGIKQRSKNKAIRAAAARAQVQVNKQVTRARVKFADDVRRRSGIGQMMIASAGNQFRAQTGLSISERLAAMSADMTLDTEALKAGLAAREDSSAFQREQIAAGARAQSGSVALAALEGGIAGAQVGMSFKESLSKLKSINDATDGVSNLRSAYGKLDDARLAITVLQSSSLAQQLSEIIRRTRDVLGATTGVEGGLGGLN